MYLKQTKFKNGRVNVSITESFRDEDKKPRNRTVKNFGYLDELEKTLGPDALEQCRAICDQMTIAAKESKKASIELSLLKKIPNQTTNRKNVGSAVITRMINDLLVERPIKI